jgi:hypothetical protein
VHCAGDIMILWTKVDQDNTMIAMGSSILPESYRARTAVDISAKGSVLTIGAARPEDGGQYKCSLALPDQRPQEIIHTVTIRGTVRLVRIRTYSTYTVTIVGVI